MYSVLSDRCLLEAADIWNSFINYQNITSGTIIRMLEVLLNLHFKICGTYPNSLAQILFASIKPQSKDGRVRMFVWVRSCRMGNVHSARWVVSRSEVPCGVRKGCERSAHWEVGWVPDRMCKGVSRWAVFVLTRCQCIHWNSTDGSHQGDKCDWG